MEATITDNALRKKGCGDQITLLSSFQPECTLFIAVMQRDVPAQLAFDGDPGLGVGDPSQDPVIGQGPWTSSSSYYIRPALVGRTNRVDFRLSIGRFSHLDRQTDRQQRAFGFC